MQLWLCHLSSKPRAMDALLIVALGGYKASAGWGGVTARGMDLTIIPMELWSMAEAVGFLTVTVVPHPPFLKLW